MAFMEGGGGGGETLPVSGAFFSGFSYNVYEKGMKICHFGLLRSLKGLTDAFYGW